MKRTTHLTSSILISLIMIGILAGCGLINASEQPTPSIAETPSDTDGGLQVEDETIPAEPAETPLEDTVESSTDTAEPTIAPTPTEPPPLTPWPLTADLFYLTEEGQVWRQPLAGDSSAAIPVTREEQVVLDFDVAPGGTWLIVRTERDVAIVTIDGRQGQIIAQDVSLPESAASGAREKTLAWSPDAGKLAYIVEGGFQILIPGADENFEALIYEVPEQPLSALSWSPGSDWLFVHRLDGSAALFTINPLQRWVELGRVNGHTWLSDGRLAFAPAEGGLALLTPGDATTREFLVPQDRQITLPAQRQDGSLAFYGHSGSIDQPGFLYTADPVEMSFSINNNVPVFTEDKHWDPAGKRIVGPGETPRTFALLDPLTGARTEVEAQGMAVSFNWGDLPPTGVTGYALPADVFYMAPQAGVIQIWRLPANGDAPQAVTTASENVTAYDVSSDGTQIVYTADRTIYRAVLNTLDVTEVVVLSEEAQDPTGTPAFSPDGRRIAYADNGIHIHNLDTGQSSRLLRDTLPGPGAERQVQIFAQPRWSPDGRWLLLRVNFYEGFDQALLQLSEDNGSLYDPLFLELYGANGEWADNQNLAYIYSRGGAYSQPFLTTVQPSGEEDISLDFARLTQQPVIDVEDLTGEQLAILRVPAAGAGGPTVVRLMTVRLTGGEMEMVSGAYVMEAARLSPDGSFIVGLIQPRLNEAGVLAGQVAIVNVESGEVYAISSTAGAFNLRWEER